MTLRRAHLHPNIAAVSDTSNQKDVGHCSAPTDAIAVEAWTRRRMAVSFRQIPELTLLAQAYILPCLLGSCGHRHICDRETDLTCNLLAAPKLGVSKSQGP